MITRLVKMSFHEDNIDEFLMIFSRVSDQIRAMDGCLHLDLLQDKSNPIIFFTYSIWSDEAALENYRTTVFFRDTWSKTKSLFCKPPEAWTTERLTP